jgi:hypothetical protein
MLTNIGDEIFEKRTNIRSKWKLKIIINTDLRKRV